MKTLTQFRNTLLTVPNAMTASSNSPFVFVYIDKAQAILACLNSSDSKPYSRILSLTLLQIILSSNKVLLIYYGVINALVPRYSQCLSVSTLSSLDCTFPNDSGSDEPASCKAWYLPAHFFPGVLIQFYSIGFRIQAFCLFVLIMYPLCVSLARSFPVSRHWRGGV